VLFTSFYRIRLETCQTLDAPGWLTLTYLICPEKRMFFMSDAIQKRVLHNVEEMGKKISDGGEAAL